jgi:hypothetical protein
VDVLSLILIDRPLLDLERGVGLQSSRNIRLYANDLHDSAALAALLD